MRDPIGEAVDWVRNGGLLAYPTETVWGLGADARSAASLERLQRWKGRDGSTPVSILVSDAAELPALGFEVTQVAERLASALWPGPMTLVLHCRSEFARGVARDDGAVGVRCSSHPLCGAIARRLAMAGLGPITATSLNNSGSHAARTLEQAREACRSGDSPPRLLDVDGAEAGGGTESTVIDATGAALEVLRWGALTPEDLEPIVGSLR
ncbi:MAG: L-threonylcarbamoyladenylate synthase [Myxococcota bacterium]|jgi:L-threonylcarbamoyladenylate synthase